MSEKGVLGQGNWHLNTKSCMEWPGIEPGHLQCEANNLPPDLWHRPKFDACLRDYMALYPITCNFTET